MSCSEAVSQGCGGAVWYPASDPGGEVRTSDRRDDVDGERATTVSFHAEESELDFGLPRHPPSQ